MPHQPVVADELQVAAVRCDDFGALGREQRGELAGRPACREDLRVGLLGLREFEVYRVSEVRGYLEDITAGNSIETAMWWMK